MAERVYADGLGPQADTHPDLARRFAEATGTSADNPRLRDRLDARLDRSPRPAV